MQNPLKRKPKPYEAERERLLTFLETLTPTSDEYAKVMAQIDKLDKILNRTTELKKTAIPAAATGIGIVGIYGLQQFAGVIVPKALDALASRSSQKNNKEPE